jgi:hypothetical protein
MAAIMEIFVGTAQLTVQPQQPLRHAHATALKEANAYLKQKNLKLADVEWSAQAILMHPGQMYIYTITIVHDDEEIAES